MRDFSAGSSAGGAVAGGFAVGQSYWQIARRGYYYDGPNKQSAVAFFPAYPLAMRALTPVFTHPLVAAIAIALGLASVLLIADRSVEPGGALVAAQGVIYLMARYAGQVGDGFICTSGKGAELYARYQELYPSLYGQGVSRSD